MTARHGTGRGLHPPVLAERQGNATMKIDRLAAFAPRTRALATDLALLKGPCVGCPGCDGLCRELIDMLVLPEAVLKKGHKE